MTGELTGELTDMANPDDDWDYPPGVGPHEGC